MKHFILFVLFFCSVFFCYAQENNEDAFQTVKGKVVDKDSKSALWGATVVIVDSAKFYGASTDSNGYFSIDKKSKASNKKEKFEYFKDTSGSINADEDTYKLIMKDKEDLLSFKTKLRFILILIPVNYRNLIY